jgi:hypothetical protein
MLLRDEGDLPAARPLLERALAILARASHPDHRWTIESRRALEELVSKLEQPPDETPRDR